MLEGGSLDLGTLDQAQSAVAGVAITVTDTGIGIPPEKIGKIFDPFFTTRTHGGSGLGLSISYTLMARYGGAITVETAPGTGLTFWIWLPAKEAAAADRSPPSITPRA